MFNKEIYIKRREKLIEKTGTGIVLLPGNVDSPMNYSDNIYSYRQDSTFLYFFGIDLPGFTGVIDIDKKEAYIFGNDYTVDDIIWMGPQPKVADLAEKAGVNDTRPVSELKTFVKEEIRSGRNVHFLPPYRGETTLMLSDLLDIKPGAIRDYASEKLIKAVVELRAVKEDFEVEEIEKALAISSEMYKAVLNNIKPGLYERDIHGIMEGIFHKAGSYYSFPPIVTVHGETLHNHYHGNLMKDGDLLLIDSGAESPEYYASDITRTFPVNGKFSPKQREIYEIVLKAEADCIAMMKPGIKNIDVHTKAAEIITSGLKELGFIKGSVEDAVENGAHALFYPHGLGHMMGLDVHDMENLGEDFVGYDKDTQRSKKMGFSGLRCGRELKPGFVLTVEPGIYFIPAWINKWKEEGICKEFIDFSKLDSYSDFGGIRIEEDVLITDNGHRILGKEKIPKSVKEIEDLIK